MKIVDLTLPLTTRMPIWPGSKKFELFWTDKIENGSDNNSSYFRSGSHAGTHIDAPGHYVQGGKNVDQIPLETLIGACCVVELRYLRCVDVAALESIQLPDRTRRLLIKTDNSNLWSAKQNQFHEDYVYLTENAARWLVQKEISLIGVDYLSVGSFQDGTKTHQRLLNAGVVIIEGLNLAEVDAGEYELICLPLRIESAEASPVRAILRTVS